MRCGPRNKGPGRKPATLPSGTRTTRPMTKPDPRTVCDGCGQSLDRRLRSHVELGPIVHTGIWRQLADDPPERLCFTCMGLRAVQRLGRMLTLADLRPCRWNLEGQPYSWCRLTKSARASLCASCERSPLRRKSARLPPQQRPAVPGAPICGSMGLPRAACMTGDGRSQDDHGA
jgi:hypothetical protein